MSTPNDTPPERQTMNHERLGWLRTLIASHKELQAKLDDHGDRDEDPTATAEMYDEVTRLADEVAMYLDLGTEIDIPSEDEVNRMAEAAGYSDADIPF